MAQNFMAPIWMTFKPALELDAHIRKSEKGSLVVYADSIKRKETDEKTGDEIDREIPQRENVDSAVGLPVVAERARNRSGCMFGVPRPNPRPHPFFQVIDDMVGNPGVDVLLFGYLHCVSPLRAFKKLDSLVMERCCAERPEQSKGSRFVAGDSSTLDGGKGRLCYGSRTRE